ncbi:MAG: hypothetical protein KatS3mg077_3362 [Candidatus Binatia bacterium]|nr:MAG: hypothetical protein KatS3mg077_3362 [Candidatus Binatia bacterium]
MSFVGRLPLAGVRVLEWGGYEAAVAGRVLAGLGAAVWMVEESTGHPLRHVGPCAAGAARDTGGLAFSFWGVGKSALALPRNDAELVPWLRANWSSVDGLITSAGPHFGTTHKRLVEDMVAKSVRHFWVHIDTTRMSSLPCEVAIGANGLGERTLSALRFILGVRAAASCVAGLLSEAGYFEELRAQDFVQELTDLIGSLTGSGGHYWDKGFQCLPTRDGWVNASILGNWDSLAYALYEAGAGAWIVAESLRDVYTRYSRADAIFDLLRTWCQPWRAVPLTRWAQVRRIPFAAVRCPTKLSTDPQLRARRFFFDCSSLTLGSVLRYPRLPIVFSRAAHPELAPVPELPSAQFIAQGQASLPECTDHRGASGAALQGVKVVDFTHALSGPLMTSWLVGYGAEVVKVDPPGLARTRQVHGEIFSALRRGKATIEASPEADSGRAKVLDLISNADLLADNLSARVMPNWGLSYRFLKNLNPRLVQVRMTAFGLTGPLRHWIAYAPTLHAWSGHTWLFGRRANGSSRGEGWPIPFADLLGAAFGLLGSLAGLFYTRRAGAGTLVDVSQYECAVFGLGPIGMVVANPDLWPQCFRAIRDGTFRGNILWGVQE